MPQGSLHWQGTQGRAYAPGAHWNVQAYGIKCKVPYIIFYYQRTSSKVSKSLVFQRHDTLLVVRGKVTTRCLWHACKALGIGLLLMLLGACMATIGYYADQLSVAQEIRGNLTIRVKNESRGFHLNNLSYAGPIVMGVGGFIVVAACVMTFEARDSAAKVVPARFRFNQASTLKAAKSQRNRKSTSSQTSKWDHQLGLFRVNRSPSPSLRESSHRRQLTAEFLQFSKTLQGKTSPIKAIKRSPSAPSLVEKKSPRGRPPRLAGGSGGGTGAGCALLNPELLKRHAISVDNPGYSPHQISRENFEYQRLNGSQVSMAMDLHIPNKGPITLKVKDRSDTARRHQLARQTKIEDAEDLEEAKRTAAANRSCSPKLPGSYSIRYPDDFVPRKRDSIDLRILEDLASRDLGSKVPIRDFRKISSPNFRNMSLDKISGERRLDKTLDPRKSSLEFRKSPDFRRSDYRKYSIERFTADCAKYLAGESQEGKARSSSGENLQRRPRHPRLHHSRSDDNRRRSFDRHRADSQSSRYSLNTQVVIEGRGMSEDYELKYFTPTTATSLDTEESRCDNSECDSHPSHPRDYHEEAIVAAAAADCLAEADALLEEPELENLPDNELEMFVGPDRRVCAHYAKQETLSSEELVYETLVDIERKSGREGSGGIEGEAKDSETTEKSVVEYETAVVDMGED